MVERDIAAETQDARMTATEVERDEPSKSSSSSSKHSPEYNTEGETEGATPGA